MKRFMILVLTGLAIALGGITTAQAHDHGCRSYRSYSYRSSCGPTYYRSYNSCGPTYYRSYSYAPRYYSRSYCAPRYYSYSYRGGYCR